MKRLKTLIVSLLVLVGIMAVTVSAAGSGKLSLSANQTTLAPGDSVTITIDLSTNPGIAAMITKLSYDPDVFELTAKSVGSTLPDNATPKLAKESTPGIVNYSLGSNTTDENYTETGVIGTFELTVKEGAHNGNYSIAVSSSEFRDCDMAAVTFDTSSTVTLTVSGGMCDHVMEAVAAKAATCEAAGNKAYYRCTVCGKIFSDSAATTEITEASTVIAALGHDWDNGTVTTPATCEAKGVKTYTCSHDNTHTKTEDIEALGHNWGEWTVTKEATCKETGVKTRVCGNDSSHVETEELPLTDHTWDEGEITTAPTCEEKGVKTYTCSVCGETRTEDIEALGHNWGEWTVTKEATCEETGVNTRVCGNDSSHVETEEIPLTDHTWDEGEITTAPTCEEKGVKTFTCSVCGETRTEEVAELGHDWDEENAEIVKNASVNAQGEKKILCKHDPEHFKIENFDIIQEDEPLIVELKVDENASDEVKESVEKIIQTLEENLPAEYKKEDTEFVDIDIQVSLDDGKTYVPATKENIPEDGVTIVVAYPAGTDAEGYDFVVLHLLSDGTVETLTPVETANGLQITVKSFSPFAISAKKTAAPSPSSGSGSGSSSSGSSGSSGNSGSSSTENTTATTTATVVAPKTADESGIGFVPVAGAFVLAVIVGGCVAIRRNKRNA